MIDWKQSLPQIIAAVIGSGLIVTAFSTIGSLIFRPIIDISVVPYPTDKNVQNMKYAISLKNIGYAPATHLRLTMSYPGVYLIRTIMNHEDENITVESERTSVVAFLPRVTSGGSISINAIVYRPSMPVNASAYSLSDFGSNIRDYSYPHYEPYSIIATYDQGSSKYNPPFFLVNDNTIDYRSSLNSNVGLPLILIALAFLFFGIAFRHKRRSKSRLASDILEDIMKVRDELDNNDKGNPSGLTIRLHAWGADADNERQIVSDYRDYQKIDDFYSSVRQRNFYLLQNQVSNDILSILNQDCVNKATIVVTEIDWRKFHKLDLVLLIPALIIGWVVYEEILIAPLLFNMDQYRLSDWIITIYFILSGVIPFFITRWTLRAVQGIIVSIYGLPPLRRSFTLLIYSFVIMQVPHVVVSLVVGLLVVSFTHTSTLTATIHSYASVTSVTVILGFVVDIGSIFLLTWVVWRRYMKHKVKSRRHFLFKKSGKLT